MRTAIILAIALGLAACGETASERQARDELERIERERDAAAAADVFSGVTPSADADDAPDADESVPGQDASCAGMADAEAFVRCLYAGIGEGWLNTREAPDGPAVFTDRTWTMGEEMRAAAPNWERVEMLCLCDAPTEVRLRSVRIEPAGSGAAVAQVELSGTGNERPSLDLVLEDGAWQVAEVRHAM